MNRGQSLFRFFFPLAFSPMKKLLFPFFFATLALGATLLSSCSTSPSYESNAPSNLANLPNATPKYEPLSRSANRPYTVLGQRYVPMTSLAPYKARGIASWYGPNFHGKDTSIGDRYDMYAMTAASKTLPLPSYARVTKLVAGRPIGPSIIVRVNDRGPFVAGRIIDLSYAAAYKLDMIRNGTAPVEVELLFPGDYSSPTMTASNANAASPAETVPASPAAAPGATVAPLPSSPAAEPRAAQPLAGEPIIASAPVPVSPPHIPVQSESSGFSVQLGAFSNRGNAESFLEKIESMLPADRFPAKMARQPNGNYSVYVGAFATKDAARAAAKEIEVRFGMTGFVK
jgi:rare lipoprotein A